MSRPRDVDERPIAWREAGQGPPVILLHAMAGSRTAWEPQMAALSASFRCIAWDMPGFGASAPPRAGAFMDDVVAALATFTLGPLGLQSAHFVGLSVGGMILQHFGARHPALVRSLTIMDTSPKFAFGGSGSPEGFLGPIVEGFEKGTSIAAFSEGMVRAIVGPRCPEAVKREAIASMARGTVAGMELAARLIAYHDGLAALARIKAPVLAIAGEADAETPVAYARHIAENVQNGELFVVPDAGHIANLENPAAVNERLLAFLSKHTG
jgi:pimeloyl-ACP methyl ester carboxylesterase